MSQIFLTQGVVKSSPESLTDSVKVPLEMKRKSKVPELPLKKKIVENLNLNSVLYSVRPEEPQRQQQTGKRKTLLFK